MIKLTNSNFRSVFLQLSICVCAGFLGSCQSSDSDKTSPAQKAQITYDTSLVGPAIQKLIDDTATKIVDQQAQQGTSDQVAASWNKLGKLFHAYQLRDQAVRAYTASLETVPGKVEAAYLLGMVHLDLVQPNLAKAAFERVLEQEPKHALAHYRLADIARNQGQLNQAVDAYRQATTLEPTLAYAWQGLGETEAELGNARAAVAAFQKVLELQPDIKQTYYQLAQVYRDLKDSLNEEKALAAREKTEKVLFIQDVYMARVNDLANLGRRWVARGDQALRSGQVGAALDAYQQAINHAPRDFVALAKLGNAHLRNNDLESAKAAYAKALEINPGNALLLFNIGSTFMEASLYPQAQTHFAKALALDPQLVEARMRLADSQRLQGQWQKALSTYAEILQQAPEFGPAYLGKAVCELSLEQRSAAADTLGLGWEKTEQNPVIGRVLAHVLVTSPEANVRDGDRALGILEVLQDKAPGSYLLETKAMALAEKGEFNQAIETLGGALATATKKGDQPSLARLQSQVAHYRQGKAWHQPFPKDHPLFQQKTF